MSERLAMCVAWIRWVLHLDHRALIDGLRRDLDAQARASADLQQIILQRVVPTLNQTTAAAQNTHERLRWHEREVPHLRRSTETLNAALARARRAQEAAQILAAGASPNGVRSEMAPDVQAALDRAREHPPDCAG